jgi:hypothetical protein
MSAPAKEEDYRMPKTFLAGASWIVRIAFYCWLTRLLTKVRFFVDFRFGCRRFFKGIILATFITVLCEAYNQHG